MNTNGGNNFRQVRPSKAIIHSAAEKASSSAAAAAGAACSSSSLSCKKSQIRSQHGGQNVGAGIKRCNPKKRPTSSSIEHAGSSLTANGASTRRLRSSRVAGGSCTGTAVVTASNAVVSSSTSAAAARVASASAEAAGGDHHHSSSSSSLSCFGALFSVLRAATDYCRYGNLRQYLLIDPNTGEPRQTFYSSSAAAGLTASASSQRTSGQSGNVSNGSEYILPPEIRAEIVAAAKRGKLQQYLQLRKHRYCICNDYL